MADFNPNERVKKMVLAIKNEVNKKPHKKKFYLIYIIY